MTIANDSALSLREARALYFERNGIPQDGGYTKRWVKVTKNRLPLYILNTGPRRRAVPFHDIHHVLTGYETTNTGEAEIAAWELAAGTWPNWFALYIDLAALATGVFLAPAKCWRAYLRGRRSRSLYAAPLTDALLATSVADARAHLGIPAESAPLAGSVVEVLRFAALGVAALATVALSVVLAPLLIAVGALLP